MNAADTAASFVDGEATIVDLRKAVADWRAAGQTLHDAIRADVGAANVDDTIARASPPVACGACARVGTNDTSVRAHAPGCANDRANRRFVTIEAKHVNKALFHAFGRAWPVSGFIGRIMKQDIGKRVYLVPCDDPRAGSILQVENDEQRAARREVQGHPAHEQRPNITTGNALPIKR